MSAAKNLLVHLRMGAVGLGAWRDFLACTRHPAGTQEKALRSILHRNRTTAFARDHRFSSIRSVAEYAQRVPIHSYDELRPYIDRQEREKTAELLPEPPLMYARTSVTSGAFKDIPIGADTVRRARRNLRLFSFCHYAAIPGLFSGKTLAFVSPAIEGHLETGTPYGSMSGLIYASMPRLLRNQYLVPPAVFGCTDHGLKYLLIAIFAAAERNVTFVAGANPSTFIKIAAVLRADAERIIAAVASGTLPGEAALGPETFAAIQKSFSADRDRAVALRTILREATQSLFSALWPELKAVSCWREGNCRVLLPAVKQLIRPEVKLVELGYLSSEFRGSLPVNSHRHIEVPTLHENFFEFVEREEWESGGRSTRPLAELEIGRSYYVIITTPDGLYRYFMNDIVRVDGRFHATPTIKFVEKGAGATNITGEKLYESQVCDAMEALQKGSGWIAPFFLLVAEPEQSRYHLYLEASAGSVPQVTERLDRELAARNIEYHSKRASGRLLPITLTVVSAGTGEAWKAHLVAEGRRESQFKFARLLPRQRLTFDFDARRAPP